MKVSKIKIKDFDEIAGLLFARWADFEKWFSQEVFKEYLEIGEAYCLKVIADDGKIIGLTLGQKVRDDSVYLRAILVVEDCRRQGIGKKLLSRFEKATKSDGCQYVRLDSGERDYGTGAFNFYNALGYKIVDFHINHNERLLIFEKVVALVK